MTAHRAPRAVAALLLAGLFAFPFLTASAACEWRLAAFFVAGVAVLPAVAAIPFAARPGAFGRSRLLAAAGLAVLAVLVWVAGLAAADVRILCRLF